MDATHWRPLLDRIAVLLDDLDARGWIVGGCLRDALLGAPVRDVDLAFTVDPLPLARRLAFLEGMGGLAQLRRGTARVMLKDWPDAHIDLTLLHGGRIEEDLAVRDFRVNAMALSLVARERFLGWLQGDRQPLHMAPPELVDPFDGIGDLRAARIDVVCDGVFRDDPGRILRAARLAARLHLTMTVRTVDLARESATRLAELATDRVREELNLSLVMPEAAESFSLLNDMRALPSLFASSAMAASSERPEDMWAHMVESLAALRWLGGPEADTPDVTDAGVPLGRLHAWYADAAPGDGQSRQVRLKWATIFHSLTPHEPVGSEAPSNFHSPIRGLLPQVSQIVNAWCGARSLLVAEDYNVVAIRRFFDRLGQGGDLAIDALIVAFACVKAQGAATWSEEELARATENLGRILNRYFDHPKSLIPPHLIDGAQVLLALGISQGPVVGRILQAVRAEQLAGNISTAEEALAFARTMFAGEI